MKYLKPYLFIIPLLYSINLFSQTKIEVEKRVNVEVVPQLAKTELAKVFPNTKVKWFIEENETKHSFEAKLKHKKNHYSVEFSSNGTFEDIEKRIKFKYIEKTAKNRITNYLDNQFSKYRILKTQLQINKLSNVILSNFNYKNLPNSKFEIIVLGQYKSYKKRYEFTFNHTGKFEKVLEISEVNQDHLEH